LFIVLQFPDLTDKRFKSALLLKYMDHDDTKTRIKVFGAELSISSESKLVEGGVFILCLAFSIFMVFAGMSLFMGGSSAEMREPPVSETADIATGDVLLMEERNDASSWDFLWLLLPVAIITIPMFFVSRFILRKIWH
jgi:hypothetical protein